MRDAQGREVDMHRWDEDADNGNVAFASEFALYIAQEALEFLIDENNMECLKALTKKFNPGQDLFDGDIENDGIIAMVIATIARMRVQRTSTAFERDRFLTTDIDARIFAGLI